MPKPSSTCAGASNSRSCTGVPGRVMFIVATSRYGGRLDDDRSGCTDWEECGQVDHQRNSTIVAPLMDRARGLDQRITRAHDHGFSWTDHVRLSGRIIGLMPLDLTGENRVGQLSLDDNADLGARVVMNGKHCSRHDGDPTES